MKHEEVLLTTGPAAVYYYLKKITVSKYLAMTLFAHSFLVLRHGDGDRDEKGKAQG